jgi:phosphohistidine phosphatase
MQAAMEVRPGFYYRQSAVIPYRRRDDALEVLLVTSSRRRRWVIPKGIVEPDLSPEASACREAFEEAGVEGRITGTCLGTYEYEKWGGTCTVRVFPLRVERVHDAWPEDHRDRRWLSPDDAAARVREPELKRLLTSLPVVLRSIEDEDA